MVDPGDDELTVEVLARRFRGPDGIQFGKLIGAFVSALIVAVAGGVISVLDAWLTLHIRFIDGVESFAEEFLGTLFASTGSMAWSAAFESALEAGMLAPVLLTAEILVVLSIIAYFRGRS